MSRRLVKKTQIVPFLNTGTADAPKWTRIAHSTTFTLAMNPQTETFDFISSETPQTEIDGYQPSLSQSITMFKGDKDYQVIFDMLFNRDTGGDAHRDALVVFYQEDATWGAHTVYKAWKVDSLVSIGQMDTTNKSLTFDLQFNDIVAGAVDLDDDGHIMFVEGTYADNVFTAKDGRAAPVAKGDNDTPVTPSGDGSPVTPDGGGTGDGTGDGNGDGTGVTT